MKWQHKGHEYDGVYEHIRAKKRFYLFGAGHGGKLVLGEIRALFGDTVVVVGFWDNNPAKSGSTYLGLPVTLPQPYGDVDSETGIIISTALAGSFRIENQLRELGWQRNINFYHYYTFVSVLAAYQEDKLFFPSVGFIPSTVCNLNCKYCLNFTPYLKKFTTRPWKEVKADIDQFFSVVDYIGFFLVTGGEPLLYPWVADTLRYLAEHYENQILELQLVTNGTVIPSDDVLRLHKQYCFTVVLDDYREALDEAKDKFEQVYQAFAQAGGEEHIAVNHFDTWIDLAPMRPVEPKSVQQLQAHFDACHVPWRSYRDGKLYLCNYADFAATAEIIPPIQENEMFDFHTYRHEDLKALMEFRLGYSEKGYTEFCRRCAGFSDINPNHVRPAEQVPRGCN